MASPNVTETRAAVDPLPPTLQLMARLATSVLVAHIAEAGVCVVCGAAWPCERVVLAAHNLAVI